jgi:hypothetical protein
MSDCMSYGGSMRNPSYRDYEKFPYGSLESSLNSTMKNTYNTMQGKYYTLAVLFCLLILTFNGRHKKVYWFLDFEKTDYLEVWKMCGILFLVLRIISNCELVLLESYSVFMHCEKFLIFKKKYKMP